MAIEDTSGRFLEGLWGHGAGVLDRFDLFEKVYGLGLFVWWQGLNLVNDGISSHFGKVGQKDAERKPDFLQPN